jgi:hypothetical protein
VSVMPKVIYDQLNHDSLVPTSMHLQLADQLIQRQVGIVEDILVRIRNSFVPVDTTDSWEAILEYRWSHD